MASNGTQGITSVRFINSSERPETFFSEGDRIISDNVEDDIVCAAGVTEKSAYLVNIYVNKQPSNERLYLSVMNRFGTQYPDVAISTLSSSIQKDPSIAMYPNSDQFAVFWSSDVDEHYQIYGRVFQLNDAGITPLTSEIPISTNAQDNIAPRAIFNNENNSMLISWAAIKDKKIHLRYIDTGLESISQEQVLQETVTNGYFSTNSINMSLQIGYSADDIVEMPMLCYSHYTYVAYKLSSDNIAIYAFHPSTMGTIEQILITTLNIDNIVYFDMAFDESNENLILIYTNGHENNHTYAISVNIYSSKEQNSNPIRINKIFGDCRKVKIKYVTDINDQNKSVFMCAWVQKNNGIRFNYLNSDLNIISNEKSTNEGETSSVYGPIITNSSNQKFIIFSAEKYLSMPLNGSGVILHVNEDF